jgi:hypothetical protein
VPLNTVITGKDTVKKYHTDSFLMCSEYCSIILSDFMQHFPRDTVKLQSSFSLTSLYFSEDK